jgi:transposase-like protein
MRFRSLSLPLADREHLEKLAKHSSTPAWRFKRCRALLLLDDGGTITSVRKSLGCSDPNVRKWIRTYQSHGLEAALSKRHGGGVGRMLSATEAQRIVALACSDPPEGFERWSVRLLTEHAPRVLEGKQISRETIRIVLVEHDIKPWRKKNVVRARA